MAIGVTIKKNCEFVTKGRLLFGEFKSIKNGGIYRKNTA
jgi:hypothetical protein